jgi:hypothetical protein
MDEHSRQLIERALDLADRALLRWDRALDLADRRLAFETQRDARIAATHAAKANGTPKPAKSSKPRVETIWGPQRGIRSPRGSS